VPVLRCWCLPGCGAGAGCTWCRGPVRAEVSGYRSLNAPWEVTCLRVAATADRPAIARSPSVCQCPSRSRFRLSLRAPTRRRISAVDAGIIGESRTAASRIASPNRITPASGGQRSRILPAPRAMSRR
jgi:hypothetical protein